jgi:NAD(P)-dependent dehydrogenase (short-subunit alcohol dehydrogenase family)
MPWGVPLVWVALVAAVRAGAWSLGTRWGSWSVLAGWLIATVALSAESPSGDVALSGGSRQLTYLLGGVIIGSAAARSGNGSPAYAAAKGALQTYAISLMRSLGPEGITANVVAPGYTDGTELVAGRISPERKERLLRGIATGRPAQAPEIAHIVASLAAPEASFINGETVTVDGGPVVSS